MSRVLVLGGSGMLGAMVVDVLAREPGVEVRATVRSAALARRCRAAVPEVEWRELDFLGEGWPELAPHLEGVELVVNAVGLTKPYARDDHPEEVERAVRINAAMPFVLARAAAAAGARVVQIATDCVYSGRRGGYLESDPHDALDVYGKTKSLGEARLPNVACLRCSIVGPEPKAYAFLLEWFRRQPPGARVNGFTNHAWNGVTTLHFARLCAGVLRGLTPLPPLQHVVPADTVSKAELLSIFARELGRPDLTVTPVEASQAVDRTLATADEDTNRALWAAASYPEPPRIAAMVRELAAFDFRLGGRL